MARKKSVPEIIQEPKKDPVTDQRKKKFESMNIRLKNKIKKGRRN